jgi:hypothetical protein
MALYKEELRKVLLDTGSASTLIKADIVGESFPKRTMSYSSYIANGCGSSNVPISEGTQSGAFRFRSIDDTVNRIISRGKFFGDKLARACIYIMPTMD